LGRYCEGEADLSEHFAEGISAVGLLGYKKYIRREFNGNANIVESSRLGGV
jgi:hypothetical protein